MAQQQQAPITLSDDQFNQIFRTIKENPTRILKSTSPEDFHEWRFHFEAKATDKNWDSAKAAQELKYCIQEEAFRYTRGLDLSTGTIKQILDRLEARFLPPTAAAATVNAFNSGRQIPGESITVFHNRLRELFLRAYPDRAKNAETDSQLIRQFVHGLSDPVVVRYILDSKPTAYSSACTSALDKEAIESSIQDIFKTKPSLNALTPGGRGRGNPNGSGRGRACWDCGDAGHVRSDCPKRDEQRRYWAKIFGVDPNLNRKSRGSSQDSRGRGRGAPRGRGFNPGFRPSMNFVDSPQPAQNTYSTPEDDFVNSFSNLSFSGN